MRAAVFPSAALCACAQVVAAYGSGRNSTSTKNLVPIRELDGVWRGYAENWNGDRDLPFAIQYPVYISVDQSSRVLTEFCAEGEV
jgi:hypothetical protein